jgi:short-subunit dehydrogenase
MKLAIVTGASSGIGNRIAEVFMGEKAIKCILISRSKPQNNLDLAGWIQCDLAKHSEFPELFSVKRIFL